MGSILVVDDEPVVLQAFEEMLSGLGHEVRTAPNGELALDCFRAHAPDVVVTDLTMPGMNGLETFRELRRINPRLPVIIMTGQGTMETAIEATKLGAFDYQLKPVEPDAILTTIERALESVRLMQRTVALNPPVPEVCADAIVGSSAGMQEVFKAIGRVAETNATVLIRGESGTGKELVARAIYQHSSRAEAEMLTLNCAAIPETLLESELFGHERGAYTGAFSRRIGRFEQSHGGTIFLDEIGDMALGLQAKLLRVLQQRTFERVGGMETVRVDVRVLAATNRNLEQAIAAGKFREDLYHRLNVVTITIPPLRERPTDIPILVQYFITRYAKEFGCDLPMISSEALDLLTTSPWPGNVRELEHCIYRAMIFTRGYPIQAGDVLQARQGDSSPSTDRSEPFEKALWLNVVRHYLERMSGPGTLEQLIAHVERIVILECLRRAHGSQTDAARLLGLPRPTLHAKIQRHEIDIELELGHTPPKTG